MSSVQKQITVKQSADRLYSFWRNFQNVPRIIDFVDAVEVDGERSHWKATGPANMNLEWDTEIINDRPNEFIAWKSTEGATLENSGSVHFNPASGDWGTVVTLNLDFNPPGGVLGDAVTKLLG